MKNQPQINRRQFLKIGAGASASASLLGASAMAANKNKLLMEVARTSATQTLQDFPVEITDKCQQMPQKNTVFCRQLWDIPFTEKIRAAAKSVDWQTLSKTHGWTALDEALNAAGWAMDHAYSPGSANGQPHTPAYAWDYSVRRKKVEFENPADAAKKVKKAARFLGASLVGIAAYNPLWTYSPLFKADREEERNDERAPAFEEIPPDFPFQPKSVVTLAFEMDYRTIGLSPSVLGGAAVGLGYSKMSTVGYSVATFLRELGYRSFACGNDVALSVPYGVAAGLGEMGRHGMLITPEFGPRVRLAKVLTELEIKPDKPRSFGAWEFCKSCKRCAESCPIEAIPKGDPTYDAPTISNNSGVLKWYVDPEKCIQFWRENGTDCANCITSCTYNKTPLWHHQFLTAVAAMPGAPLHSLMARMDKLFGYGNTHDIKGNANFWESE